METWTRAIPESRDRWQSRGLVWVVGALLLAACLRMVVLSFHPLNAGYFALRAGVVSLTFAVVVWALRAATPWAASCGGMICLLVTVGTERLDRLAEIHSGLMPLMGLFLLTFAAGKVGRAKTKARTSGVQRTDSHEERRGRSASQVLANLGTAGLISAACLSAAGLSPAVLAHRFNLLPPHGGVTSSMALLLRVAMLGALAEATADTVSSEIGAAFGGNPLLLTTFRRVEPGTDGAVSALGTAAGFVGAAAVALIGLWSMNLPPNAGWAAAGGGALGLLFDSLLGATVERRGWLGNDGVNFLSTIFGAMVAFGLGLL